MSKTIISLLISTTILYFSSAVAGPQGCVGSECTLTATVINHTKNPLTLNANISYGNWAPQPSLILEPNQSLTYNIVPVRNYVLYYAIANMTFSNGANSCTIGGERETASHDTSWSLPTCTGSYKINKQGDTFTISG